MDPNAPALIERKLTLDILRGDYTVGSRLPTLRELARAFAVNPSTIQRVIARLEARGLVTPRQGSGLRVNDPHQVGDLSLLPFWIEASLDDPPRAATLLDELLELRRVVVARLIVRHRSRLLEAMPTLSEAGTAAAQAATESPEALRQADLAFARAFLSATGNTVAVSVFNSVARLLLELPLVARAMYSEPRLNAVSLIEVLSALREGPHNLGDQVEQAIARVDLNTVRRFEASLWDSNGGSHETHKKT